MHVFCMKHKSVALKLQSSKREQNQTKTQLHKDPILPKENLADFFFFKDDPEYTLQLRFNAPKYE